MSAGNDLDDAAILSAAYQTITDTLGTDPTVSVRNVQATLGIRNSWQTNSTAERIRRTLISAGFTYAYTRNRRARYRPPK